MAPHPHEARRGSDRRADDPSTPPAISVVMSTFNRAGLLPAAVEHLVRQTSAPLYEIIVIDNNSTDETPAVLEELAARHPRLVRRGFERRQGVSYGRNRGIELSRAAIVAFTDDDVVVTPEWVASVTDAMAAHPEVECVGGRVLPVWKTAPPAWMTPAHWSPLALVDYGDEALYVDLARPLCLVTSNVAYRRAALDAIGWFSPAFPRCQDHELLLRLWHAGGRGLYLPSLVVKCEVPPARLTWAYHRRWYREHGRFCALMGAELAEGAPAVAASNMRTLFGSPATMYRECLSNAARAGWLALRGRVSEAREAEALALDRAAFLGTRARMWRADRRAAFLAPAAGSGPAPEGRASSTVRHWRSACISAAAEGEPSPTSTNEHGA